MNRPQSMRRRAATFGALLAALFWVVIAALPILDGYLTAEQPVSHQAR
jgi:hypothetical protein